MGEAQTVQNHKENQYFLVAGQLVGVVVVGVVVVVVVVVIEVVPWCGETKDQYYAYRRARER